MSQLKPKRNQSKWGKRIGDITLGGDRFADPRHMERLRESWSPFRSIEHKKYHDGFSRALAGMGEEES